MAEKKGNVDTKKKATSKKNTVKKTNTKSANAKKSGSTKKVSKPKTSTKKVSEAKKTTKKTIQKKEVVEKKIEPIVEEKKTLKDDIDFKRYVYFAGILAIAFILLASMIELATYYIYDSFHDSYLLSTNIISRDHKINLKDAKASFSKLDGDYFIYITYTDNKQVYEFEKKLKKLIDKYDISDKFYYINTDDYVDSEYYIDFINTYLGFKDAFVLKTPTIIYVNKDNEVVYNNIITRADNEMMNIGDVQKLLDINGF